MSGLFRLLGINRVLIDVRRVVLYRYLHRHLQVDLQLESHVACQNFKQFQAATVD